MAEVALAGKGGSVFLPGTPYAPITQVNTWTLTMEANNYDASVLGDSWRHFVAGLRGWNGAINGYYNLVNDTAGQYQLFNAYLNSETLVVQMQVAPGGGMFEGNIIITRAAVSDPVDGLITLDFTYIGTGSLQHLPI